MQEIDHQHPSQLLQQAAGQLERVLVDLRRQHEELARAGSVAEKPVDPGRSGGQHDVSGTSCPEGLARLQRVLSAGQALADSLNSAAARSAAQNPQGGPP